MTNKEQVRRNIGLSFDFVRQIIKYPSMLKSIKNGSYIEFIEKDFPIKEHRENKHKVKYYRVNQNFEDIK